MLLHLALLSLFIADVLGGTRSTNGAVRLFSFTCFSLFSLMALV